MAPPFGSLGLQNCIVKWAKLRHGPPFVSWASGFWLEIWVSSGEKRDGPWVKTFFFYFFWRSPNFGRKKPLNFGFRPKNHSEFWRRPFFFFGDHPILGGKNLWIFELSETFCLNFRTNRLQLIQDQWKFESRSFAHFSLFQNSPPFSKSWLRACSWPPPFSKSCVRYWVEVLFFSYSCFKFGVISFSQVYFYQNRSWSLIESSA